MDAVDACRQHRSEFADPGADMKTALTDINVLTFDDLKKKGWPYTRVHTRRLVLAGQFPKPFKAAGSGLNLWFESEINAYFAERAKARTRAYAYEG
jgi:prophage regulatory protein